MEGVVLLKTKRDELIHPKEHAHIHKASKDDFEQLKKVFKDYDDFVNELMNDFFVGTTIRVDWGKHG